MITLLILKVSLFILNSCRCIHFHVYQDFCIKREKYEIFNIMTLMSVKFVTSTVVQFINVHGRLNYFYESMLVTQYQLLKQLLFNKCCSLNSKWPNAAHIHVNLKLLLPSLVNKRKHCLWNVSGINQKSVYSTKDNSSFFKTVNTLIIWDFILLVFVELTKLLAAFLDAFCSFSNSHHHYITTIETTLIGQSFVCR